MAKEKQEAESAGSNKKGAGKKLLFIGIALFFVIQIGVSYLIISSVIMPMKELKAGAQVEESEEEQKEIPPIGHIFPLDQVIVNPANSNGMRYFKLSLALEVSEEKFLKELESRKPQMLDIIIEILSNKSLADLDSPEGKFILKKELMESFNSRLSEARIDQLFFTEFVLQ